MGTPFRRLAPLGLFAVVISTIAAHQTLIYAEPVRSEKPTAVDVSTAKGNFAAPAEEHARELLEKPLSQEFAETPLNEVCEQISKKSGIKLELDEKALKEAGIDSDTAVHGALYKDLSLASSLRLMFREMHLTYVVTPDGAVLVTTPEAANLMSGVKLHHVQDLITAKDELGEEYLCYESLVEAIPAIIQPQSWDQAGGGGSIKGLLGG